MKKSSEVAAKIGRALDNGAGLGGMSRVTEAEATHDGFNVLCQRRREYPAGRLENGDKPGVAVSDYGIFAWTGHLSFRKWYDEKGRIKAVSHGVTSRALNYVDRRPPHPEFATQFFDAGLRRAPGGLGSAVDCPLLPYVLREQRSGRDSNELRATNRPLLARVAADRSRQGNASVRKPLSPGLTELRHVSSHGLVLGGNW